MFAKSIFEHWVINGDPLSLEYLTRLKPVLDPRFIQSEFEMSFTEPKGAVHFASFIGINTLYGMFIQNQQIRANYWYDMNNPKWMSKGTMNGFFSVMKQL
ncbi:MAG: hypothetical protein R2827_16015 [Bdellovibrionales bacterium]